MYFLGLWSYLLGARLPQAVRALDVYWPPLQLCALGVGWPNSRHVICVYFPRMPRLCCHVNERVVLSVIRLRFILVENRCVQSFIERLTPGGRSELLDLGLRTRFYYGCTGIVYCALLVLSSPVRLE